MKILLSPTPRVSDAAGLGQSPRFHISNKCLVMGTLLAQRPHLKPLHLGVFRLSHGKGERKTSNSFYDTLDTTYLLVHRLWIKKGVLPMLRSHV